MESDFSKHSVVRAKVEAYNVCFHVLAKAVLHMVTPESMMID